MNRKLFLVFASAAIAFSMIACSFGGILPGGSSTEVPVVASTPTNNPPVAGVVEVTSTSITTTSDGSVYLFGEILNNSDAPITGIELSVEITDASGASLITDMDGNVVASTTAYPMLYTLAAGEYSPFAYYLGVPSATPANHNVTVTGYTEGTANRGDVQHENVQIVEDGYGNYYLTGELVNMSDQWVHINALAGGVLDDANTTLSADWTSTYVSELAPAGDEALRDRTPFAVDFPIPTQDATQWVIWVDADLKPDVVDYPLAVNVTNSYFDDYGDAHLVGYVTNSSDQFLTTALVGGLYDADGLVLDAGYTFTGMPMAPGEAVPFDISYFGVVNYSETQAALVSSYSVQFDSWSTYEPYYSVTDLTSSGETAQKSGASWTVSGTATNSSTSNLSSITVLVAVFDSADNLVAFNYSYSYPEGDSYAPGDTATYDVYLYLDPTADLSSYYTQTFVIGDISE